MTKDTHTEECPFGPAVKSFTCPPRDICRFSELHCMHAKPLENTSISNKINNLWHIYSKEYTGEVKVNRLYNMDIIKKYNVIIRVLLGI